MAKPLHSAWIGLCVLAHVVGSSGVAHADEIETKIEASITHVRCRAYARAGADLRAAFDAAVSANIDVAVRSQLLIRASAAFRAGELWLDAATALEAYAALTPVPFDARFRLAEAVQLRAFADGHMDARLEGDMDLDGLIDGDLDFDGVVDATATVHVPRPNIDPRFGLDIDGNGRAEAFIGIPLGRIATYLGSLAIRGGASASAGARAGIDWRALGARYRAAFDAGAGAHIAIGARVQLLLRAAAAYRRGEFWIDAAGALEAYAALTPPQVDVRLRAGEAVQLRAFARGDMDARLETGLGLGGLLGAAASLDHRYGMDFDADGDLDTLIGVELSRIAAALGTDADMPGLSAIDTDLPDLDIRAPLGAVGDVAGDLDLPNPHLALMKGLGFGVGGFALVGGIVGMSVGLRAHGISADLPPGVMLSGPQLALHTKLLRWMKATLSIGGIAAAGAITAVIILAVRGNRPDADLDLDCEARWRLAPGPGLAGLALERTW